MTAGRVQRRVIIDAFDPRKTKAGGIDTCIRGLLKYRPADVEIHIAGVDTQGDLELGARHEWDFEGSPYSFTAIARLDNTDMRPKVPHTLKMVGGIARFRPGRDADVIQSHRATIGAFVGRTTSKPQVQFLHNDGETNLKTAGESYFSRAAWAYRALEHATVRRAVDVVVFNAAGAERLRAVSDRVRFSPTWYEPSIFFPAGVARAERRGRLLWVARMDPAKDPVLAVETLANLGAEYSLTMVGAGTLAEEPRRRAAELGVADRVDFAGVVPKDRVGELMRAHDVLLMTSHFEGYPRAVVEALACGLPVVSTFGGEPNGLVSDGANGYRVEPRDPAALARAIERCADIGADACVSSVSGLSAAERVPDVLGWR
ncbi:glycosyltransferase family 4 protein [uncultured Jatrophihabitans sp.]|uniref:glycosyltransferase family 4 protein n=1 Tax=uncultured Jatrophihabitans sp. TaxID=1610747 RepID=UPI0035CB4D9F